MKNPISVRDQLLHSFVDSLSVSQRNLLNCIGVLAWADKCFDDAKVDHKKHSGGNYLAKTYQELTLMKIRKKIDGTMEHYRKSGYVDLAYHLFKDIGNEAISVSEPISFKGSKLHIPDPKKISELSYVPALSGLYMLNDFRSCFMKHKNMRFGQREIDDLITFLSEKNDVTAQALKTSICYSDTLIHRITTHKPDPSMWPDPQESDAILKEIDSA